MPADYVRAFEHFDIQAAANVIWKAITDADQLIQEKAPFKLVKTDRAAGQAVIADLVQRVYSIAKMLEPIMPQTSAAIQGIVIGHKMPDAPLFLRKE